MGIAFIDLKKHLMLWITKSSAISLSSMVYSIGLNPILQIISNVTGLMMLRYRRGNMKLECHRVHALALLLFFIYVNDLPFVLQDSNVSMYSDGTSLCYQSNDMTQLKEVVNNDLKKLDSWLQVHQLSLNVAKTQKHIPCFLLLSKNVGYLKNNIRLWT